MSALNDLDVLDDAATSRKDNGSAAIGKPIDRVDGRRKITGAARYAAEFKHDRLAHAVLVQSTISKGRITSIDTAAGQYRSFPRRRDAARLRGMRRRLL